MTGQVFDRNPRQDQKTDVIGDQAEVVPGAISRCEDAPRMAAACLGDAAAA
jgi:hypothetical protein